MIRDKKAVIQILKNAGYAVFEDYDNGCEIMKICEKKETEQHIQYITVATLKEV